MKYQSEVIAQVVASKLSSDIVSRGAQDIYEIAELAYNSYDFIMSNLCEDDERQQLREREIANLLRLTHKALTNAHKELLEAMEIIKKI